MSEYDAPRVISLKPDAHTMACAYALSLLGHSTPLVPSFQPAASGDDGELMGLWSRKQSLVAIGSIAVVLGVLGVGAGLLTHGMQVQQQCASAVERAADLDSRIDLALDRIESADQVIDTDASVVGFSDDPDRAGLRTQADGAAADVHPFGEVNCATKAERDNLTARLDDAEPGVADLEQAERDLTNAVSAWQSR